MIPSKIILNKIIKYVSQNKNNYNIDYKFNSFISYNKDVLKFLQKQLKEQTWFESIKNVLKLTYKGIYEKKYCKNCGNVLNINSVKNGSVLYCSGGCKSKDKNKIENEKNKLKKIKEDCYSVDFSKEVDYSVFDENKSPTKEVDYKIQKFLQKDFRGNGFCNFLINNKDVDKYFQNLVLVCSWMNNKKEALWYFKHQIFQPIRCKNCGKILLKDKLKNNHIFCSVKCAQNDNEVRNKFVQKSLQIYGTKNPFQNQKIQEKARKTCKQKYGVQFASQSKQIKDKVKNTCLEKFNETSSLKNQNVREKIKNTCIEKYGVQSVLENKQIQEKIRKTCLQKYGTENVSKNQKLKNKILRSKLNTQFDKIIQRFKDYVVPLFKQEDYLGMVNKKSYKWKCVRCGNEFETYKRSTSYFRRMSKVPLCPVCFPPMTISSFLQKEILEFIKSIYNGKIIQNDRSLIHPLQLDIYLPQLKLAIEFNGNFWHNSEIKDKNYHLNKTLLCEKQGIQLIHIFEDEWKYKQQIVKDILKSKLGIYDRKIYARRCIFKQIDEKTASEFLERNHLQGYIDSDVRYGLYYKDELVFVMTFRKSRKNGSYDYELTRFASNMGVCVVGGVSRLLSTFKRNYNGSLVSYADRRYCDGEIYKKLGFELIGQSKPKCIKIDKYQIFDCGNLIYVMK